MRVKSNRVNYIPAYCETCRRAALVAVQPNDGNFTNCEACGQRLRLIPGPAYTSRDHALFESLQDVVRRAEIGQSRALELSYELERGARGEVELELVLDAVAERLPGLRDLALAHGEARTEKLRSIVSLLTMLLSAMAHVPPRPSSMPLAVAVPRDVFAPMPARKIS